MKVIVVGGTGLIGRHVVAALRARGDDVVVVSRRPPDPSAGIDAQWDQEGPFPRDLLDGADAVVNFAGRPVVGVRWDEERKREMWSSRVDVTRAIAEAIAEVGPVTLVNGSAVGYYGDRGDEVLTEAANPGTGFLSDLSAAWEEATTPAVVAGACVVCVRTGIVMSGGGGALVTFARLTKLFAGGPIAGGRQWFAWVDMDDVVGLVEWSLDNDAIRGPVNLVAPEQVRQREFARVLGRVLGRPAITPSPEFAIRLALGEGADAAVSGQRAVPAAALDGGYVFRRPELEPALRAALGRA